MTVPQGAALSIGAVLGTGVIALPALAAQAAGPASLLAWAGLVAVSVPLATTFAALGARYPDAGGVATYARIAFGRGGGRAGGAGRYAAAIVGWSFYFAVPLGAPAAALFAGAYVASALGGGTVVTSRRTEGRSPARSRGWDVQGIELVRAGVQLRGRRPSRPSAAVVASRPGLMSASMHAMSLPRSAARDAVSRGWCAPRRAWRTPRSHGQTGTARICSCSVCWLTSARPTSLRSADDRPQPIGMV